jgi:hypothetical protein
MDNPSRSRVTLRIRLIAPSSVVVSAGGPRIKRHHNDHLDRNFVTNVLLPLRFVGRLFGWARLRAG